MMPTQAQAETVFEKVFENVGEVKNFNYKDGGGRDGEIEVHFPEGHDATKKAVPGIIMFHGGAWRKGDKSSFSYLCHYFASRGLVAATANYKLVEKGVTAIAGESIKRVCITDTKSAIRWYKENASKLGVDPERIIAGGGSAGGHVCLLATHNPGLNNPSDNEDYDTSVKAYLLFNPALKGVDAKDPEVDFLQYIKKDQPPAIVIFGTKDKWLKGWKPAYQKMKDLGVENIDSWSAKEQGHAFFNNQPWADVTIKVCDEFLIKNGFLDGEPTLKDPETGETLTKNP